MNKKEILELRKTFRPEEIVVINLSGRGDKDMQTYKRMNKFLHL